MSEDEFTKLFKYMQTEFKKIDSRFNAVDIRIDHLTNAVDAYAKQSETYMQEMLALGNKVDRLEKQIEQIAAHLNIKLAY
jgi:archaellum component FlaC